MTENLTIKSLLVVATQPGAVTWGCVSSWGVGEQLQFNINTVGIGTVLIYFFRACICCYSNLWTFILDLDLRKLHCAYTQLLNSSWVIIIIILYTIACATGLVRCIEYNSNVNLCNYHWIKYIQFTDLGILSK